jgi:phosphoribosylformimino-5-aminoimidazole carboxamide ribotide isomerase
MMDLYPAIDLLGGRCVRLVQGDFATSTSYADDPVAVARGFEAAGARWIHVVDLDAARRTGDNLAAIEAVAAAVGVPIQVGGGVRDSSLLDVGVARIVVGSLAVEDPDQVRRLAIAHPGRVAVGLDHRDGEVRVRGWQEGGGLGVGEALAQLDGAPLAAVVVTEIARDGMMTGPDLAGLTAVLAVTDVPVIASGGVAALGDLRALAGLRGAGPGGAPGRGRGLAGVIVGKALYEGRFGVRAALDTLAAVA